MKPIIVFFITFLLVAPIFGQEKEKKEKKPFTPSFDEYTLSVNRTNMTAMPSNYINRYYGYENRFGGGAGVYHSSVLSKRWNYMYGLEYNYTSLFVDHVSYPHYLRRHEENVTFHIHTVSLMPVAFRFSIGNNVKYFLESGLFLGVSIASKQGEAYEIYPLPPSPEHPEGKIPVKIGGNIGLSGGPSLGIGMRIPMKGIEWVVKVDYKAGLDGINGSDFYQYYRLGVGVKKRK